MAGVELNNLKSVRALMGRSQAEIAGMLGISVRAVQSYEQGWRDVPAHVQRMLALLLFLNWRKGGNKVVPCWKERGCSREKRKECAVYQSDAGDLCWLISGNLHSGKTWEDCETKLAECGKCPVMTKWLNGTNSSVRGEPDAPDSGQA